MVDSIIISISISQETDSAVLIVGQKTPGEVCDIINVFKGQEALDLYNKLKTKKGKED